MSVKERRGKSNRLLMNRCPNRSKQYRLLLTVDSRWAIQISRSIVSVNNTCNVTLTWRSNSRSKKWSTKNCWRRSWTWKKRTRRRQFI